MENPKQLTAKAQEDRSQFIAEYGSERGDCSCHICAPCSSCTHPGNPHNQEENDECWESAKKQNDMKLQTFNAGDVIRQQNLCGGFRCWKVVGVHLGGKSQESSYELVPLDIKQNKIIQVPCAMLEVALGIEKV